MQNTIQKFRQSSIVFKKPGILFEHFDELQLFAETSRTFSTYQKCLQKDVWDFFNFI